MTTSEDIIKLIEQHGTDIMSRIITTAIEEHKPVAKILQDSYGRYIGKTPIKKRKDVDRTGLSVNMKMANDFYGIIVDELKGFVFGKDIKTIYPDDAGQAIIREFKVKNSVAALDTDLAEFMLSTGQGVRLCYVELGTGDIRITNRDPWQTIFIYDMSGNIQFALIYYDWEMWDIPSAKQTKTRRVEWYDKEEVTYYVKQGGKYVKETGKVLVDGEPKDIENPIEHMFNDVPVIKFIPNSRSQSAFAKVTHLIDGYDVAMSDWLNEIVDHRNAYIKTTGALMDKEAQLESRETGILNLPDKDSDVDFLIKQIDPAFVENLLKMVNDNIYKFSKTVDMSDESFTGGGAESGESRKWKMLAMFLEAVVLEVFFTKGLREMYKVLASAWNVSSEKVDYLLIDFKFSRNLPVDLLYMAEVLTKLWDRYPIEEIYKLLSFIDDPAAMKKLLDAEKDVDLDAIPEGDEVNE